MSENANIMTAEKVQKVINTLKLLEMPTSYDNVNYMLGIYTTLIEVRDYMTTAAEDQKPAEAPEVEENDKEA